MKPLAITTLAAALLTPSGAAQQLVATLEGGQPLVQLGFAVSGAGDVNGDGVPDFVARAHHEVLPSGDAARIHAFHGPQLGPTLQISVTLPSPAPNTDFGVDLAAGADFDGDGFDDLLAGAPDASPSAPGQGQAHLYLGSPGGLGVAPALSLQSFQAGAAFGWSLDAAGDVDADGFVDAIIAAPYLDFGGALNLGRVWLYRGAASGLDPQPAWFKDGTGPSDAFGKCVFGAGDLNGDGFDDFGASVLWGPPTGGSFGPGRVSLWLGQPGAPSATPSHTLLSPNAKFDDFGLSVDAGDWNGDGYSDLIVGAPYLATGGRVYTYHGAAAGAPTLASTWIGPSSDSGYGYGVASAGDLDRDGRDEALVYAESDGTPWPNGFPLAELHAGSPSGLVAAPTWTTAPGEMSSTIDLQASSLAGVGDVDQDGFFDFVLGARYFTAPNQQEGRVAVYGGRCSTAAAWSNYGAGKAGANGVPSLTLSAAPKAGAATTMTLANALPGATPIVFLGAAPSALPFDGGLLLVSPVFTLLLPPIGPTGALALPFAVPLDPTLCGDVAYVQVMYVDPAAAGALHVAQTPGLQVTIGG